MNRAQIIGIVDGEIKRKLQMATLCESTGQTEIASGHREVAAALTEVLQVYLNKTEHPYHSAGPAPPWDALYGPSAPLIIQMRAKTEEIPFYSCEPERSIYG